MPYDYPWKYKIITFEEFNRVGSMRDNIKTILTKSGDVFVFIKYMDEYKPQHNIED